MTAAVRLRLLLAEDRPTIQGYDQDEFARRLHYDRPHEASLELFRLARAVDRGAAGSPDARPTGCARARTREVGRVRRRSAG